MTRDKLIRILRQPTTIIALAGVLALAGLTAIPSLRRDLTSKLDAGANLLLLDGDVDDPAEDAGENSDDNAVGTDGKKAEKPSGFKRAVSAPGRWMARLFKRGGDNKVAKRTEAKDFERMKIVPVNRTEHGVPGEAGQIADTNSAARTATTSEANAQNLFEEGVRLHDKGRLDGAIEKLMAATLVNPSLAEAFNLLAVCYDEKGNYKAAQDEYKKALKLDPNNARFLNNLGYSYYLAGDNGNAVKWYGKGLKLTPNDRRMHNNIGLAYGRKGDFDKARQHFVLAVGDAGADLNIAYVYSQQGKYDEAIRHYEAALRAQPNSLPAMSNLAQLYDRTGRVREAAILNDQYKKLSVAAQAKEQSVNR